MLIFGFWDYFIMNCSWKRYTLYFEMWSKSCKDQNVQHGTPSSSSTLTIPNGVLTNINIDKTLPISVKV